MTQRFWKNLNLGCQNHSRPHHPLFLNVNFSHHIIPSKAEAFHQTGWGNEVLISFKYVIRREGGWCWDGTFEKNFITGNIETTVTVIWIFPFTTQCSWLLFLLEYEFSLEISSLKTQISVIPSYIFSAHSWRIVNLIGSHRTIYS